MAAAPGSRVYGSMSVLTQVACDVRLAFGVPPGAFSPPPQVDSAVIHLRHRAAPRVAIGRVARSVPASECAGTGIPIRDASTGTEAARSIAACQGGATGRECIAATV